MLIQAALNGSRAPGDHPALPVTPAELAADARSVVDAGAGALHLHVRGGGGEESLTPPDVARTLAAVRRACPRVPVGVSTGAWIEPDLEARLRLLSAWTVLPDFASVNFHESGAARVALLLLERGVGVEAGLSGPEAAEKLVRSGLSSRCLRILLEPSDRAPAVTFWSIDQTEAVLDRAGVDRPRLLHGEDAATWPVLRSACLRGYDTRIGLEDVLVLPDGSVASGNVDLLRTAVRLCQTS